DRFWFMNPVGLWDVMFQEIASFGNEIVRDLDNPILVIDGEQIPFSEYNGIDNVFNTNDTITYNLVRSGEQTYFDKQFRDRFGYGLTDFVDVFSVDPSQLSLDLFAPDDLWREGNELLSYRGYDYLGTKLTNQPAFEDFWTAKDANGNYTRPIDAARPIYMAGFIQDKFSFRDLIFNIGVRVDRFDANQKVPKDAFSPLYATRSAGEINLSDFNIDNVPSTIGDDFVVYVDDEINPSKIIGYRNPNADLQGEWYNSNGLLITDIQSLQEEVGGNLKPYLAAPLSDNPISDIQNENYDPKLAFEDYEPQITVAPRIAFSFNISDEAIFFAHYDVLSQRPQGRLITSPEDYFFMPNRVGTTINNASLKPERTIDYQIGFKQKLGNTSALTVAGFYRELKDMVQLTQVRFAYPFTYSTYGNIDFGTVKGLELTYDLRRTGNVRMTASYTLQFADATASGDEAPVSLVDFGVPNLRSTFPVNWDARHTLNMNMDYRFGEGRDYNGPELFGAKIFQNAGLNLTMRARSGTPFGRQDNPTPTAQFGVASRANLDGNPNGSRLPWNFVINGRLDKDFKLQFSQAENAKAHYINLYVQVQNLLDADNIQGVYAFTGSPDDDGFVLSPEGQEVIINQTDVQAFSDQYNSKVLDPNNFSLPRTVRLGLRFDF
ncbi:MAG: TonB-dependent receptor domain-containing protein, partial [Chitinophagales bacterium]